jgi:predicted MFS family arabinose efflux permease
MGRTVARLKASAGIWTGHLLTLAIATFFVNLGQGLFRGASTNFFVDTLGLTGTRVLWLAGIREIPGLALMFVAALIMHLPLTYRTALSVVLMGVGYGLYAVVNSYTALIAVAVFASLGFHVWMPLQRALAMGLTTRDRSGRVMGVLSSVRAFAAIVGMGAIALLSSLLSDVSLRMYYAVGGLAIVVAALLILRLPKTLGANPIGQRRLLLKKRYWLYYVLTFFEGSRTQVFGTFGTLILVQHYGLDVWQISLLLLTSSVVNLVVTPFFGYLLDQWGESRTLSLSYVFLALCFVGYATIHSALILGALVVAINLLVTLSMGLSTYVNRIAPEEELTPTLSAGVSINHITSVTMSLLAGSLLEVVGYEGLCWGAAGIIMLSVPFAMAIRADQARAQAPQPATTAH